MLFNVYPGEPGLSHARTIEFPGQGVAHTPSRGDASGVAVCHCPRCQVPSLGVVTHTTQLDFGIGSG